MTSHEAVIGLEMHVQLGTRTKMFCADVVTHDAPPNTHVCPVCLGLPGALPALNEQAVVLAVRAATMLRCTVHPVSRFVRKNYFYPDLPKGYQITQLDEPLATNGEVMLARTGTPVRIGRVHIEEDAGKLLHDRVPGRTAIDLNRCGIPLLEIVTEPDLHSAADAVAVARQLRQILQYADVSDCDMELGSLRIDANVSVRSGQGRTEIKNLNSFTQLEKAITQEVDRQTVTAARGGMVANETLIWDAERAELRVLRSKEQREEYRYFPEPDLPPLHLGAELIARALVDLPELPSDREARFCQQLGISAGSARSLAATRALADYFEAVIAAGTEPKAAAGWILTHVLAWCNIHQQSISQYPMEAATLADLLARMTRGELSHEGARRVAGVLEAGVADTASIISELGVAQRADPEAVTKAIDQLLMEEGAAVAQYRAGGTNVFAYLMGRLVALAGPGINPRDAGVELRARLERS